MMADAPHVFLDTAYVFALLNTRDQWHASAKRWQARLTKEQRPILTSQFVFIEIADGLSSLGFRKQAIIVLDTLAASRFVEIIPASPEFYAEALDMYRARADKQWGLTDCSSFAIMQRRGLQDVLSTDRHFTQAGYRPLLLEEP